MVGFTYWPAHLFGSMEEDEDSGRSDVSYPRAIKICYPILIAIDKKFNYDIFLHVHNH